MGLDGGREAYGVKLGSLEWTGTDDSRLEWDLCLRFGIGVIALVCTLQSVILMDPTCRRRPRIALADLMLFVIHSISATKLTWDPLLKVGVHCGFVRLVSITDTVQTADGLAADVLYSRGQKQMVHLHFARLDHQNAFTVILRPQVQGLGTKQQCKNRLYSFVP